MQILYRGVFTFALLLCSPAYWSASADDYSRPVFKGAEPLETPKMMFPKSEALRGAEGWVVISYVVDEKGVVIDPVIEDSTGSKAFEKEALRAVKRSRYTPATLDGKPVQQCYTRRKTTFALEGGSRGARRAFVKEYKKAIESLKKDDLPTAAQQIAALEEGKWKNLYEESFFWLLKAQYAAKQKNDRAQMQSLRRAVAYEQGYLPATLFTTAAAKLFQLQVNTGQYAEALSTYAMLEKAPKAGTVLNKMQKTQAQIISLAEGDQAFLTNGEISEDVWNIGLLKKSFSFQEVNGKIDAVDIRCSQKRRKFEFIADKQWNIPASWGKCNLYVEGEPGARFGLVQGSS